MADREYISVAEAAKRAGISKQAVYQRLNKDLNKYQQVIDGKICLDINVLNVLLKQVDSSNQQEESSTLNDLIDTLRLQLLTKDKQIAALQQALEREQRAVEANQELLKTTQETLNTAHALMAGNIQVLLKQSSSDTENTNCDTASDKENVLNRKPFESFFELFRKSKK